MEEEARNAWSSGISIFQKVKNAEIQNNYFDILMSLIIEPVLWRKTYKKLLQYPFLLYYSAALDLTRWQDLDS